MLLEFGQRLAAAGVSRMPLEVQEEDIPGLGTAQRERLNPRQVDPVPLERPQGFGEGPRLMGNLQQHRRLVATRGAGHFIANDGEAGHVARVVFDVRRDDLQVVLHSGLSAGHCRRSGLVAGQLRGGRGAGHLHQPGLWHVPRQPLATLRQRLRLAVDLRDFRPLAAGQQVVMNRQLHLAADLERQPGEHVERVHNPPIGAVLDGGDAKIGAMAADFFEDRRDVADRNKDRRGPEAFDGGQVGEAVLGAQVGNPGPLDQLPRAGDQLAEHRPHFDRAERPDSGLRDQLFPGVVGQRSKPRLLGTGGELNLLEGQRGAAVDQLDQLAIDPGQFGVHRRGARFLATATATPRTCRWAGRGRPWRGTGRPGGRPAGKFRLGCLFRHGPASAASGQTRGNWTGFSQQNRRFNGTLSRCQATAAGSWTSSQIPAERGLSNPRSPHRRPGLHFLAVAPPATPRLECRHFGSQ